MTPEPLRREVDRRQRARVKGLVAIAAVIAIALVFYFGTWANYSECRDAGFTVRYCALTHLVR